jgi:hypothetical protein
MQSWRNRKAFFSVVNHIAEPIVSCFVHIVPWKIAGLTVQNDEVTASGLPLLCVA